MDLLNILQKCHVFFFGNFFKIGSTSEIFWLAAALDGLSYVGQLISTLVLVSSG
jgi:hypothetical protein